MISREADMQPTRAIRMPIHCCCRAQLLGYVTVSIDLICEGARIKFALRRDPQNSIGSAPVSVSDPPNNELSLEVAELHDETGGRCLALKSRDYPLPTIARIPSFKTVEMEWLSAR